MSNDTKTPILTSDHQKIILRAEKALALDTRVTRVLVPLVADLLGVIRDMRQNTALALRDEQYKWRNMLVDLLEDCENNQSQFTDVESVLQHFYEQIVEYK